MNKLLLALLSLNILLYSQTDTVSYPYPVPPFNVSQPLSGAFSEFRNTGSSDHFHNAIDLPEPDNNPVYPSIDGTVYSIVTTSGSNNYVSVLSQHGGAYKRITYLHIQPNPSLFVGMPVSTGSTVLGTIYPGMGHVHLIERELIPGPNNYGVEINNVRPGGGGVYPFYDNYNPVIHLNTLEFRIDGSTRTLPAHNLTSRIDIIIKMEEINGSGGIYENNGSYIVGWRLHSADTTQVVYEQFPQGITYKFDIKPDNSDVHNVFVQGIATLSDPVYYITNGNGAGFINQTGTVNNNYFDTDLVDEGDYILEVFAEDTRNNYVNRYIPVTITRNDILPPERPTLLTLENYNGAKGVEFSWMPPSDTDLFGYRLYYAKDAQMNNWAIAADESTLTADLNFYRLEGNEEFEETPANDDVYFFYLTAIDSAGNESEPTDVYSRSSYSGENTYPKMLIVDGFDRYLGSASFKLPVHDFNTDYFVAVTVNDSIVISSCANEAVEMDSVDLKEYDYVVWFVGDESTELQTFSANERLEASQYLENGGNLFVSGSEIGWDLDNAHSGTEPSDTLFYRHYLKSDYINDGSSNMSLASGMAGTGFEGVSAAIGTIYPEDYPDDIEPINGAVAIMEYNQVREPGVTRKAGVAYSGTFGNSSEISNMIYISFPFETIGVFSQRRILMQKVLEFFGNPATDLEELNQIPLEFSLSNNYPNPFNPTTKINYTIPESGPVTGVVYDVLGRKVETLVSQEQTAGHYSINWNASRLSAGVYIFRLNSSKFSKSIKMILLK
ncbi:MAG: hypothetical protein SCALA702_16090 [Melioribacteraceae bacterium]|nr:MAG: hypothetical protein SCALA702_16090 [Melioribacteraceae bacterium]